MNEWLLWVISQGFPKVDGHLCIDARIVLEQKNSATIPLTGLEPSTLGLSLALTFYPYTLPISASSHCLED